VGCPLIGSGENIKWNNQIEVLGHDVMIFYRISAQYPDHTGPSKKNVGQAQYLECGTSAQENLQLPPSGERLLGIKNAQSLQHLL
jgi:hypothetical protein